MLLFFRLLLFGSILLWTGLPAYAQRTTIKVGLITPLSGPRASIGEDASQGAQLALDHLKKSDLASEGLIQLMIEDSQGDPARGVSAYHKLVQDGARFILTQNSNVSMAIAPLVDKDRVLQLAITTTSERYARPADNTFRTNGPTKPEAELMGALLERRLPPGSRLGIVTMQDEYPITLQRYLLEELRRKGFVLQEEEFLPQETDFRALLTRLAQGRIRALVFLGYQTQAGLFMKQLRASGSPVKLVLMNTPVNNREFFEAAGPSAEGVLLTYPAPDYSHPAAKEFQERFGKEPNFFSSNAYDGVVLAQRAAAACRFTIDLACWREALFAIKEFNGLSGRKGFDSVNGDMSDTYVLMIARGGRFVPVQQQ